MFVCCCLCLCWVFMNVFLFCCTHRMKYEPNQRKKPLVFFYWTWWWWSSFEFSIFWWSMMSNEWKKKMIFFILFDCCCCCFDEFVAINSNQRKMLNVNRLNVKIWFVLFDFFLQNNKLRKKRNEWNWKQWRFCYLFVEIFELKSCQLYFGFGKKRNKLRRTRKLGKEMMKTTIHRNKQHQRRERERER